MNYKIQLIGTTRTQIVCHNRLKLWHGDPEKRKSRGLEQSNEDEVVPSLDSSLDEVLDQGVERFGGYVHVCADDAIPEQPVHHRSQRERHPPLRYMYMYGHYYTH